MLDVAGLRRELAERDAAARRQDATDLRDARRADLWWMAAGAGLMIGTLALLAGLLAIWRAWLG